MKGYGQSPAHQLAVTPHVSLTSIREYLNVVSKRSLVTLNMISANYSCRSLLLSSLWAVHSPFVFPEHLSILPSPALCTGRVPFQPVSPVLLCPLANGDDVRIRGGRKKERLVYLFSSLCLLTQTTGSSSKGHPASSMKPSSVSAT